MERDFWNVGSCFLYNCYSFQGQNIEFLPLLNPDITMFDCYKADHWQSLSFFEIFTHILHFFFWSIIDVLLCADFRSAK